MQGISVKLMDHMGGDFRVFQAAKATMGDANEYVEQETNVTRLINFLARERHVTPFRHPQITVECEAPIFIARQLGKHQVGFSWNERSMRYRDSIIGVFSPESWYGRPASLHDGSTDVDVSGNLHHFVTDSSGKLLPIPVGDAYLEYIDYCLDFYQKMLAANVAPEQARMCLPQSMLTRWVWTGSLWGFFEIYRQRISSHAQSEVQDFAKQLDVIMKDLYPIAWKALKETING